MPLKRHHKIIIGGSSTILLIFMITTGILLYTLFIRQEFNYNSLEGKIIELNIETQSKLNELTESILKTKTAIQSTEQSLSSQINSVNEEMDLLKASASEDFSGIIEDSIKSVVTIRTDIGQGTGFIITDNGFIVTNAHVLVGGREINAINYEQKQITANFIGYDANLDIALLKIDGEYDSIQIANSNDVQIGEKVIAIGNPLGLQFSVSEGIVSAIHRTGPSDLEAYIQTDAALNPGNSGGPLINKQGQVIGINNFKISAGESLGFALESNYLKQAVNQISMQTFNQSLI